jgi:hypothetical protein
LKEIVHDKRYGALRTLGERKQAFNEYLGQRKKVEAEERRRRQKKAREEFVKMLEECEELSSSLKWRCGFQLITRSLVLVFILYVTYVLMETIPSPAKQ